MTVAASSSSPIYVDVRRGSVPQMASTQPQLKRFHSTPPAAHYSAGAAWRPRSPWGCQSCARSPGMVHRSPRAWPPAYPESAFIHATSVPLHMSPIIFPVSPRSSSRPPSPSSFHRCTHEPSSACRSALLRSNPPPTSSSARFFQRWKKNLVAVFRWDDRDMSSLEYVSTETTTDPESRATESCSVSPKRIKPPRLSRRWLIVAAGALLGVCLMIVLILALTVIIPGRIEKILYRAEMLVDQVRLYDLTASSFSVAMTGKMLKKSGASVELTSPEGLGVYHLLMPEPGLDFKGDEVRRLDTDDWMDPQLAIDRAVTQTQIGMLFIEPMKSKGQESQLEVSGQVVVTDQNAFTDFCDDLFTTGSSVWLLKGNAHVSVKGLKFTNIKFLRALEIHGLPLGPEKAMQGLGAATNEGLKIDSMSMQTAQREDGTAYVKIASSATMVNQGPTVLEDFGPVALDLVYRNETIANVHAQSMPFALGENPLEFEGELRTESPALGPMMRHVLAEPSLPLSVTNLAADSPNVFAAAFAQLKLDMEVATGGGGLAPVLAIRVPEIMAVPAAAVPSTGPSFPSEYIPPFPNPAVRALLDRIAARRARRRVRRLSESNDDEALQELMKFRSSEGRNLQQRKGGLARTLIEGGLGAFQGSGPALAKIGQVLQGVTQSLFTPVRSVSPERVSAFLSNADFDGASVEWSSSPTEIVQRIEKHIGKVNLTGPIEAAVWHPFESISVNYVSIFGPVEAYLEDQWREVGTFGGHFMGQPVDDNDAILDELGITETNVRMGLLDGKVEAVKLDGASFFEPQKNAGLIEFLKAIFLTSKVKVRIPKADLQASAVADGIVPVLLNDDEYKHEMELEGLSGFGQVQILNMSLETTNHNEEDGLTLKLELQHTSDSPITVDSGPVLLDWIYSGVALGPITVLNLHMRPGENHWNVNVGMYPVSSTAQQLSKLVTDLMTRRDFRMCVGRRSQRSAEELLWIERSTSPWTPLLDSILNELVQACIILPNPLSALSNAGLFPVMSNLAMTILRKISKFSNDQR